MEATGDSKRRPIVTTDLIYGHWAWRVGWLIREFKKKSPSLGQKGFLGRFFHCFLLPIGFFWSFLTRSHLDGLVGRIDLQDVC